MRSAHQDLDTQLESCVGQFAKLDEAKIISKQDDRNTTLPWAHQLNLIMYQKDHVSACAADTAQQAPDETSSARREDCKGGELQQ